MFWLLPFLSIIIPALPAHIIFLRAQCDKGKQSNLENVNMWHVILMVGKLELACLGHLSQPPALPTSPPQPYMCSLFWSQQLLPTQLMWQSWEISPTLSHSWPWPVQIGPLAIQTSRKEKKSIITMKYYNTEVYEVKCKTPHSPNLNPHLPMALPSSEWPLL